MPVRAANTVRAKSGAEEIAWMARAENGSARRSAARIQAGQQAERCWKAWVLARLGGERNVNIAHELGYKDGSAITNLLNRLENPISKQPSPARYQAPLQTEFESTLSAFKS